MTRLLVRGIGQLLTMAQRQDDLLGTVEDAFVLIEDGRIAAFGSAADSNATGPLGDAVIIDARGRLVTPGLIEPHAHPIFAGSRALEFDLRARGATYLEIQQAGGGILSTVRATSDASDEQLVASTRARLDRLLAHGVTICEAKSGYALSIPGELRLLRLLQRAARDHAVEISPTLLAHVLPPDAQSGASRDRYIDQFIAEAIPTAARESLAEAVDVFCDRGAFTVDETRRILTAARDHRLALRVHAEQLSHTGAADVAAELGARSVEHLEHLADESIPRLAAAGTICTLLPGAALTLRLPFPDARRLLDGGCEVALGTDVNPGSSLTENLPLMMSLACMQMGMSCAEAWRAVTVAAAKAVGRSDAGRIGVGARGDLVIWDCADPRELIQHYGASHARLVVARGRVAYERA